MMSSLKYYLALIIFISACKPSKVCIDEFQFVSNQIDSLVIRKYGDSAFDPLQSTLGSLRTFCMHKPSSRKIQRYQSAATALINLHLNPNRNNEAFAAALLTYINAKSEIEALLYRPNLLRRR
jgi:hypothetical protein